MDIVNEQIDAFLKMVTEDNNYAIKTIYEGQKTIVLDKKTGFIHIIDSFRENYNLDILTKDTVEAILELWGENTE